MKPHHQRTVDRLVEHFQADSGFLALIVGGSIARGWERDDSDVDILLLASDEEYARRKPTNDFHYFAADVCDYPGGYVDGKILDRAYLEEVARCGSEPARAAFVGASVAWSRCPDLDDLLRSITTYPEEQRLEKIRSFYAQFQCMMWYAGEGVRLNNRYLLLHSLTDLVLYGSRLLLAYNRVFFPYHKWMLTELAGLPEKPAHLIEFTDALLAEPSQANFEAYTSCVLGFTEWNQPPEGWPMRFMEDTEWAWRRGKAPIEDW